VRDKNDRQKKLGIKEKINTDEIKKKRVNLIENFFFYISIRVFKYSTIKKFKKI
jgi:hypothetical protein